MRIVELLPLVLSPHEETHPINLRAAAMTNTSVIFNGCQLFNFQMLGCVFYYSCYLELKKTFLKEELAKKPQKNKLSTHLLSLPESERSSHMEFPETRKQMCVVVTANT